MAQNKLNVFHWHIVDSQSFPYQSTAFPNLSAKEAYDQTHIYTEQDIEDVIKYAADRGIRVIPEFDTPGHSTSWGYGRDSLLTKCYSGAHPNGEVGPVDPSNPQNYEFLAKLFQEVLSRFPDQYVHLGGDEVPFSCWLSNPDVQAYMKAHNISNGAQLEANYISRLLALVEQARTTSPVEYIVWQEVFDNGVKVNSKTIIEEWKSRSDQSRAQELSRITQAGLRAITASCWYLNYISYGIDWMNYYACDPHDFDGTVAQKKLVIGGEVCMWGEYVDGTNVISRTWPRASAVAERLWSNSNTKDATLFAPRLEAHRCRMLKRGFQVEPANGPGFCPEEWPL
jgi:hexosaminidase